jgi:starvation-inducible DNA-binding protein
MKHPHEGIKSTAPGLNPTLNDIPEKTRKKVVKLLNQLLVDGVDLHSQVKQAHWNIKGSNFIGLHKLFDKVAAAVDEYTDEIAERAVELGGIARGTVRVAARESQLSEYPLEIVASREHVKALSLALSKFGKALRDGIAETAESDADTSDLLTDVSREIDKWLWMVEAHNQG